MQPCAGVRPARVAYAGQFRVESSFEVRWTGCAGHAPCSCTTQLWRSLRSLLGLSAEPFLLSDGTRLSPCLNAVETLYLGAQSDRTHLSAGHLNRHGWLERFLAPLLLLQ